VRQRLHTLKEATAPRVAACHARASAPRGMMGFVADASSGSSTGPAMASARAAASARRAEHRPRFHNASEPRPASGAAREPTRTRAACAVPKQRARARARSATRRAVAGGTPADGHNFFWAAGRARASPALPKRTRRRGRCTARPSGCCLTAWGRRWRGAKKQRQACALNAAAPAACAVLTR
jgi:hypothetical protein